jgi:hypothetical protein
MQTVRLPLVGSMNQRGIDGEASLSVPEDQRFLNCAFTVVQNPVTGKNSVYMERRPGWATDSLVSAGNASTGLAKPQAFNATLSAFGDTNSEVFVGTVSVGTITGRALHFTETLISSSAYVMLRSSDGTGWYYVDGAKDVTAYTADGNNSTTITDIKIAGATNTAGLYPGQKLTAGANIPAGTRVVSVNAGAFTAVLDTATTGGAFNDLAITKEPIAKILDADFITTGTYISAFAEMDGYLFYPTDDGKLRNSDLNSVTAYTSTNFISPAMAPDKPIAVARQKNIIVCFGQGSSEKFYNAGNATGSPLQRMAQHFEKIGTIDQRSVTSIEDDIFYVSAPLEGDVGVWMMRGLQSKKISTATMDKLLGTVAVDGAIYASSFRLGGQAYAAFYLSSASDGPASSLLLESGDVLLLESGDEILLEDTPGQVASFVRLYVYNIDLNIWGEWDCDEATFIDAVSSGTANQLLAASRSNTGGKIYTINPVANGEIYQDDGSTYDCQIRTARIDHGTGKRKFVSELKLVCDRQDAGTVLCEASDDDYRTWFTLGTFDLTEMEPKITRCGSYKGGRAYRLTHSYNGAFRAEALDITFDVAKQ